MIEYSMKALTAEELSFKVNHIQAAPNAKVVSRIVAMSFCEPRS